MHASPQRPLGDQKVLAPHCREAEKTPAQGYSGQVSAFAATCTHPARTALENESVSQRFPPPMLLLVALKHDGEDRWLI